VDHGYCPKCQAAQVMDTKLTVVAGPPASGKTTYVREHKQPGDLVIDMDALAVALGSDVSHGHDERILPFVFAARDGALERMGRPNDIGRVWIIRGAPSNRERREWWQATVVVLETPADECKRRAAEAGRPSIWADLIDAWWSDYETNATDEVLR
jgi:hypothetical protein